MTEDQNKIDANFFQLVVSLQMAAMQNMGKIASPLTGQIERNMDQAKVSIEMLAMLSAKTKDNLTGEEKDLLNRALYELRMNFIDETKKEEAEAGEKATGTDSEKGEQKAGQAGRDEPGQNEEADEQESDSENKKTDGD